MLKLEKNQLKIVNYKKDPSNSSIVFNISGPNINYVVVNTIRRTMVSDIPIYAFSKFNIEKKNQIFHNNIIELRMQQMPVLGVENTIDFYEVPKDQELSTINEGNKGGDEDNVQLDVDKSPDTLSLKQLTMYINYKNKSDKIVSVTTDDAKFYFGEKQIPSPYKYPVQIIKVQPNLEISFSAITDVKTEKYGGAMYSAVSGLAYKEISDTSYNFSYESRGGQISEKRILIVALININRKIQNFQKLLDDNDVSPDEKKDEEGHVTEGVIVVNGESHTLGNLISRAMQQHTDLSFGGYRMIHPLSTKVNIEYKMKKAGNIKKILKEINNYYIALFDQMRTDVEKNF